MKKEIEKVKAVGQALATKKWTVEDLQEIFFVLAMVSVFIGCWLIYKIGLSFLVCGCILLWVVFRIKKSEGNK